MARFHSSFSEGGASAKLIETAKEMIKGGLKAVQPWDEKGFKLPGGPVYSAAGANLWPAAIAISRRETFGNYPACLLYTSNTWSPATWR